MAATDVRHVARERALELLYESALKESSVADVVASLPVAPDPFVVELVTAAERSKATAEEAISRAASKWPLDRLALIDRLIMVLAIGEALSDSPPPDAVVLDEAVELATTYSTDASPRFVNGVLAAIFPTLSR